MKFRSFAHPMALAIAFGLVVSTGVAGAARADAVAAAGVGGQNCTYTLGYWKNHPSDWPVETIRVGSVVYAPSELLAILSQPPAGNGLLTLSHQVITARLNIEQGAQAPVHILAALEAADALIGERVAAPLGTDALLPGSVAELVNTLDAFNNGRLGPFHCGSTTAASTPTWGALKSIYR